MSKVIIIITLIISAGFLYSEVIQPAYASVLFSCSSLSDEEVIKKTGRIPVGTFDPNANETIIILPDNLTIDDPDIQRVIKHEFIHNAQYRDRRLFDCNPPLNLGRFLNELEADAFKWYPDPVYNYFYGGLR